ncbi:nicotinate-nucleotide pyrophosphorylase (carboxylating) [Arthrobacter sp. CAN_A6]|uniref:carboxylating nicotinate-nucleotide diphosphorylase n=1 Tax=Arthrobacter sp. CAN_A6 TaxID=2787721 RepID=UPI0018CB6580
MTEARYRFGHPVGGAPGPLLQPPPAAVVDRIVASALDEDAPWGDITCQVLVPDGLCASGSITAREAGIFCGASILEAAFRLTDPSIEVRMAVRDGESFGPGTVLATLDGPAAAILTAERSALNLIQRLCGIATLTRDFVEAVQGTDARVADTRKTTPGLRVLERFAVRCGGGFNHRFSLSDAVMAKDNHLALLSADGPAALTERLREARARLPHTVHFEVEVDRLDQIAPVLAAGVDTILLDNFSLQDLMAGVAQINGRALVEASGNVRLETIAAIARTGVDVISSGALTHSARALDLGLDFTPNR